MNKTVSRAAGRGWLLLLHRARTLAILWCSLKPRALERRESPLREQCGGIFTFKRSRRQNRGSASAVSVDYRNPFQVLCVYRNLYHVSGKSIARVGFIPSRNND